MKDDPEPSASALRDERLHDIERQLSQNQGPTYADLHGYAVWLTVELRKAFRAAGAPKPDVRFISGIRKAADLLEENDRNADERFGPACLDPVKGLRAYADKLEAEVKKSDYWHQDVQEE